MAVLVDPGMHDPLTQDEHAQRAVKLPLKIAAVASSRQPYLLLLGGLLMSERCVNASLRLAIEEGAGWHDSDGLRPRSVCAWLVPEDMESPNWQAIGAALEEHAFIESPVPPHLARVFRFWDPRVAPRLPSVVGAPMWAAALHRMGLRQWWTVDDAANLLRIGAEHPEPAAASVDETAPHWQLDQRQWQALQVLRWCNHLAQTGRAWTLQAPPGAEMLGDIVRRALALGLDAEADMRSFGHLALTVHVRFDEHPEVRLGLEQWRVEGRLAGGFAALAQAWGDDFLDDLARGDWLRTDAEASHKSHKSARP